MIIMHIANVRDQEQQMKYRLFFQTQRILMRANVHEMLGIIVRGRENKQHNKQLFYSDHVSNRSQYP